MIYWRNPCSAGRDKERRSVTRLTDQKIPPSLRQRKREGEESVLLSEQTRREKREIEITRLGWMNGLGLEWARERESEREAVMTGAAMWGRCRRR